MKKEQIIKAIEAAKTNSKKRKFTQRVDLIISLKDLNVKKGEGKVNIFVELPQDSGKKVKICGLVAGELASSAKKEFDLVITNDQFDEYKSKKKEFKKIAQQYDYFVAQATIMPQVAKAFGPVLGKKGKIPNPKAGCVVPPNADLATVKKKLQRTVKVNSKSELAVKCAVGTETMDAAVLAENIIAVYNRVKSALPNEEHNIKKAMVKLTMGPPVTI